MIPPTNEELALSIEELAECVKELARILRGEGSIEQIRLDPVYKKASRAKDRVKSL